MLALIALLALAAPPCPCGPNAACADSRCESHGGSGACACRFPAPKFSSAVYASVPAPKFKVETRDEKWNAIRNRVAKGENLTLYAGVAVPKGATGVKLDRTLDGQTGVFDCFCGEDGEPKMAKRENAVAKVAPQVVTMVKGHEHKCGSCGTVWAHADNSANASHNCPKCGRTQMVQHRDVMVPVASKPVAAPKAESQPYIPLQSYFAPSRSNCPDGNCPNAAPVRRGLFR